MTGATEQLSPALPVHEHQFSALKRALEAWPYLFMAVSLAGLIYIGLNAIQ